MSVSVTVDLSEHILVMLLEFHDEKNKKGCDEQSLEYKKTEVDDLFRTKCNHLST